VVRAKAFTGGGGVKATVDSDSTACGRRANLSVVKKKPSDRGGRLR
jgi:hypothetical protein